MNDSREDKTLEINIIPKFLDEALTPIARESGERLSDIVSLVFTPIIKAKAVRDKNLENFLKELDKEVKKIPEDNIQEPPIHIVAPILEDVSKYYCDESYLRSMFVKLIASSMNNNSRVHPSFTDIIKQLSRYDLALLYYFFTPLKIENSELYDCTKFAATFSYRKIEKDWRFASEFIGYDVKNDKHRWIQGKKLLVSLLNLQRLSLIYIRDDKPIEGTDIKELGIEPHDLSCIAFSVESENSKGSEKDLKDEIEKEIREYIYVAAIGTAYLEEFMNVCYSEQLYKDIDLEMIFK